MSKKLLSKPMIMIMIAVALISSIVCVCIMRQGYEHGDEYVNAMESWDTHSNPKEVPEGYTIIIIDGEEKLFPVAPEGYAIVVTDGTPAYLKNACSSGYHYFFDIPFIQEMELLGAEIDWVGERQGKLIYEGQSFFVDLDKECITNADGEVLSYEHDDCYWVYMCCTKDDDLIIDNVTFSYFFSRAGLETQMTFGDTSEEHNVFYLYTEEYYNNHVDN